jgi:hypothetical protein
MEWRNSERFSQSYRQGKISLDQFSSMSALNEFVTFLKKFSFSSSSSSIRDKTKEKSSIFSDF